MNNYHIKKTVLSTIREADTQERRERSHLADIFREVFTDVVAFEP